jgi:phospholipase/carboxylesterase
MTSGIHHITLIARKVQANVDFYVGFLGLRLVKRTGGYEDANQLHLFYGDAEGSPGSLVTFLMWEDGGRGRVGHSQPSEIAFAIRPESIGFWLTRALQFNIATSGPSQEFGEPVLGLKDPDGVIVKLVGTEAVSATAPWSTRDIPEEDAIRRLRGATILTEKPAESVRFLKTHFGYSETASSDTIRRLTSASGDVIDVRDATGFWTSAPGTGTPWNKWGSTCDAMAPAPSTRMTANTSIRSTCASPAARSTNWQATCPASPSTNPRKPSAPNSSSPHISAPPGKNCCSPCRSSHCRENRA